MAKRWGNWTFDPELNTLDLTMNGQHYYQLDLDKFTTSAALLDMIFQVSGKTWANADCVRDMLSALQDTIDPQRTLCSWGIERGSVHRERSIRLSQ